MSILHEDLTRTTRALDKRVKPDGKVSFESLLVKNPEESRVRNSDTKIKNLPGFVTSCRAF